MRRLIVIFFFFTISCFLSFYFFNYLFYSPQELTSKEKDKVLSAFSKEVVVPEGWNTYKTRDFSFDVPNVNINVGTTSGQLVGNYFYRVGSDHVSFTLQVVNDPDILKLDDYSQIIERKDEGYVASETKLAGNTGVVFTKEKFLKEEAFFFLIDHKIYSLVFSGPDGVVDNYAEKTLSSFSFNKDNN